jgi:Zn-dependent M28 family amino/carboxypeptidase
MNKDLILSITDRDRQQRLKKITSLITRKYELHVPIVDQFSNTSELTNIVIPAKDQENKITLMAHWDVFPGSLGFNDNSTGVITLLKMQELVKEHIEIVFTDGEEVGGRGCWYYLRDHELPKHAINVDVVGLAGEIFYEPYVEDTVFDIPKSYNYYPSIPFSDSYILEDYEVPNILILTGKSKDTLIKDIFEAEHNGVNDNKIELIDEKTMDNVFTSILELL